ncbi:methylated-DNA--[protein]-cysteine S-methyltransferase [Desertibaculum subflavum]|uniref:methylated-DNA--[protein]-cysteine S-methyltransferase n=1 Tax=Desertibaculum subflavum TaxID=2268458 RepID=UPI000E663674
MPPLTLKLERVPVAIGTILLLTDEAARVRALDWEDFEGRFRQLLRLHYGARGIEIVEQRPASPARRAVEAYFAGDLRAIDTLAVETGGTPFQRDVWAALRNIPAGETRSYGGLAVEIGRPKAVRAVGLANGSNPISIIVPCHRVIGSDGSLTGYGGGLPRKRWLLAHEGALSARSAA